MFLRFGWKLALDFLVAWRCEGKTKKYFIDICMAICKMFMSARLYDLYICE
jgi:hypothetical protein